MIRDRRDFLRTGLFNGEATLNMSPSLLSTLDNFYSCVRDATATHHDFDRHGPKLMDMYKNPSPDFVREITLKLWRHADIRTALLYFPLDLVLDVVRADMVDVRVDIVSDFMEQMLHTINALKMTNVEGHVSSTPMVAGLVDIGDQARLMSEFMTPIRVELLKIQRDESTTSITITYDGGLIVKCTYDYMLTSVSPDLRSMIRGVVDPMLATEEDRLAVKLAKDQRADKFLDGKSDITLAKLSNSGVLAVELSNWNQQRQSSICTRVYAGKLQLPKKKLVLAPPSNYMENLKKARQKSDLLYSENNPDSVNALFTIIKNINGSCVQLYSFKVGKVARGMVPLGVDQLRLVVELEALQRCLGLTHESETVNSMFYFHPSGQHYRESLMPTMKLVRKAMAMRKQFGKLVLAHRQTKTQRDLYTELLRMYLDAIKTVYRKNGLMLPLLCSSTIASSSDHDQVRTKSALILRRRKAILDVFPPEQGTVVFEMMMARIDHSEDDEEEVKEEVQVAGKEEADEEVVQQKEVEEEEVDGVEQQADDGDEEEYEEEYELEEEEATKEDIVAFNNKALKWGCETFDNEEKDAEDDFDLVLLKKESEVAKRHWFLVNKCDFDDVPDLPDVHPDSLPMPFVLNHADNLDKALASVPRRAFEAAEGPQVYDLTAANLRVGYFARYLLGILDTANGRENDSVIGLAYWFYPSSGSYRVNTSPNQLTVDEISTSIMEWEQEPSPKKCTEQQLMHLNLLMFCDGCLDLIDCL